MPFEIAAATEETAESFLRAVYRAFGADYPKNEERELRRFLATMPLARTRAAFEGNEVVATLGNAPLPLRVPGGSVPMAGTTMVTVQSTHRRRGLQRELMTSHLEDARAHGEPIAGLWTSQVPIYGRYGYGNSHDRYEVDIDAGSLDMRAGEVAGDVRFVDPGEAPGLLGPVYDRAMVERPGMLGRSADWWRWEILHDDEARRHGMSAFRIAVREGPAGADGYVIFRQRENWDGFVARGKLSIAELVATDHRARADMWRYITNVDLYPVVDYWNLPTDDELLWRVADSRKLRRRVWDGLWLRILDVPAALEARSYLADGGLRIRVSDPLFPDIERTYELAVVDGRATCRVVDGEPDVTMGIEILGALYLGGRSAASFHRAGLVTGSEASIRRADSMFRWHVDPWCPEIF